MSPQSSLAHESFASSDRASTRPSSGDRRALETYEDRMASFVSAKHAIAFANARTALAAILRASGLEPGDEVILSPLTCKVVPLTLLSLGLKPRFSDISAATLNLDATYLASRAGPSTRAVLFQHTYGSPAGVDSVAEWSATHRLLLVEDCAQCVPRTRDGVPRRSQAAIFSNNLLKPLPAGSGGLAVTDSLDLARGIVALRDEYAVMSRTQDRRLRLASWIHDHVMRPRLYWPLLATFERFDDSYRRRPLAVEVQAEITNMAHRPSSYQIRRGGQSYGQLEAIVAQRRRCTAEYARALCGMKQIDIPAIDPSLPLYYFPVLVRNKSALVQAARRRGIEIIAWPRSTPIYPIEDAARLPQYGYEPGSCPVADATAGRLVGLPTHRRISARHLARIVELLRDHAA